MIDDIITSIDSPVFHSAQYFGDCIELYSYDGTWQVFDVSRSEYLELYKFYDHETCLKILSEHHCRFLARNG